MVINKQSTLQTTQIGSWFNLKITEYLDDDGYQHIPIYFVSLELAHHELWSSFELDLLATHNKEEAFFFFEKIFKNHKMAISHFVNHYGEGDY